MNAHRTATALALLLLPGSAMAETADEILKKVDATLAAATDQVATTKMTLTDADGKTKSREVTIKQKGDKDGRIGDGRK